AAEVDLQVVVVGEGCLDDLLLDLAVQRNEHLLSRVVLAEVDERILLGELYQCTMEGSAIGAAQRADGRFEGWRREEVESGGCGRRAHGIADLHVGQAVELANLSRVDRWTLGSGASVEDTDRGDLPTVDLIGG